MTQFYVTFHGPIRMRAQDSLLDFDISVMVTAKDYKGALAAVRTPVESSAVTIQRMPS